MYNVSLAALEVREYYCIPNRKQPICRTVCKTVRIIEQWYNVFIQVFFSLWLILCVAYFMCRLFYYVSLNRKKNPFFKENSIQRAN